MLIFNKTASFSRDRAERLITGDVNWAEVYKIPSVWADRAPTALRFTRQEWSAYVQGGTWRALFANSALVQQAPALTWLLVVELLGLAGSLRIMSFGPASVWLWAGLLVCGASAAIWQNRAELGCFWRERRAALATVASRLKRGRTYSATWIWHHPGSGAPRPLN